MDTALGRGGRGCVFAATDQLLSGTFLRSGTQVRVTAQLVSAGDGTVLWSSTAQHAFDDVLTLQDDICRAILGALPADGAPPGDHPPV